MNGLATFYGWALLTAIGGVVGFVVGWACCDWNYSSGAASIPEGGAGAARPFQPPTYDDPNCREAQMVVIERDASGKPTVWCDPEIADLIRALNSGGVPTEASCSGHGEKPGWIALKDGRQFAIVPDLDSFKRLLASARPPALERYELAMEHYELVMVPKLQPTDEPDWDECIRQAEVATGLKVERHTLSIVIREVRRWLAGRASGMEVGRG